jgi:hypothetical protein
MLETVAMCCNLKRMKMQKTKGLAVILLSTEHFSCLSCGIENLSKSVYRSGFMGCKFETFSKIICNCSTVNIQITLVLYFNNIVLFLNKLFLHYLSFCTRLSCFSLFFSIKIYFSGVKLLRRMINFIFQK